ncbi:MAG: hypothetical protein PUC98_03710, partial [Clostridiales bacterium]|nr:hypothetical protein [Clostridiales bacterium]
MTKIRKNHNRRTIGRGALLSLLLVVSLFVYGIPAYSETPERSRFFNVSEDVGSEIRNLVDGLYTDNERLIQAYVFSGSDVIVPLEESETVVRMQSYLHDFELDPSVTETLIGYCRSFADSDASEDRMEIYYTADDENSRLMFINEAGNEILLNDIEGSVLTEYGDGRYSLSISVISAEDRSAAYYLDEAAGSTIFKLTGTGSLAVNAICLETGRNGFAVARAMTGETSFCEEFAETSIVQEPDSETGVIYSISGNNAYLGTTRGQDQELIICRDGYNIEFNEELGTEQIRSGVLARREAAENVSYIDDELEAQQLMVQSLVFLRDKSAFLFEHSSGELLSDMYIRYIVNDRAVSRHIFMHEDGAALIGMKLSETPAASEAVLISVSAVPDIYNIATLNIFSDYQGELMFVKGADIGIPASDYIDDLSEQDKNKLTGDGLISESVSGVGSASTAAAEAEAVGAGTAESAETGAAVSAESDAAVSAEAGADESTETG